MIGPELNHLKGFDLGMDMFSGSGGLVGRYNGDGGALFDVKFVNGIYPVHVHGPNEGMSIIDDESIPKRVTHYAPDSSIDYSKDSALRLANGGWVVPT